MGWLIAAVIIALILILKISVRIDLADEMRLAVGIGIFRLKILPAKKKTLRLKDYKIKKFRKNQEKAAKKAAAAEKSKSERESDKKDAKTAAKVKEARRIAADEEKPERDILGLVAKILGVVKVFIARFGHHLRIDVRRINIAVATGDAAKTAVLYGAICGGVQCIMEFLLNVSHTKLKAPAEVVVTPDFLGEKTRAVMDLTFSFRLWQLFDILIRSGIRFLKKSED
ncbi:MAG: DUF2953 domain-containing protein [Ruminococcaceae bacterium]|nr:DUF2953 domain-containing protein [Oscillospiraceae bacterium]